MRNKIPITFFAGFCTFLLLQCQPQKDTYPLKTESAEFRITPCQITYKGQPLPLGQPLDEWVKLLGPYSRNFNEHTYIWDSLGFVIDNEYITFDEKNVPAERRKKDHFYIFFMNLDSETGKEGKLQYAWGYYPITPEKEKRMLSPNPNYPDVIPFTPKEVEEFKEERHPKNYIYPYHPYMGTVDFQGAPVTAGMNLSQVNKERSKIQGIDKLGYWDKDLNWKNERGSTSVKSGEMIEFVDDVWRCKDKDFVYFTSLRYSEGELEYLKVEYLAKEDEK